MAAALGAGTLRELPGASALRRGAPSVTDGMIVTLEISTEFIACPICHLVIDEYELLVQANVEPAFDAVGDVDDIEYEEYNNE